MGVVFPVLDYTLWSSLRHSICHYFATMSTTSNDAPDPSYTPDPSLYYQQYKVAVYDNLLTGAVYGER
jgi:hypothetical protein